VTDSYGARQLRQDQSLTDQDADRVADTVAAMFWTVQDDWDSTDITPVGYAGKQWLENRYLVARMPVQGVAMERPTDRTVGES